MITLVSGDLAATEAMKQFILDVCAIKAFLTQQNRVAESSLPNFAMMTPLNRRRLATNVTDFADCTLTASIAPTSPADGTGTMTVTGVSLGAVTVGATVWGESVASGTKVVSQTSGAAGGIGVYVVSVSQTAAAQDMAAGLIEVTAPMQLSIQVDFYGESSGDNAALFSTLFRDEYATTFFEAWPGITPLHADEGRQAAFIPEEQQYQGRWIVRAELQADAVVAVPQQFAAALLAEIVNVDAVYPPS